MDMGSYDSPTFLGQKDKYLMGLSLPQLMVAAVVGVFWFLVSLMFGRGGAGADVDYRGVGPW